MKKMSTASIGAALSATLSLALLSAADATETLTVVSFGGAYGAAQEKHMIEPFVAETGVKVLFEDYVGGIAEIKAQVDSSNVQWDVVDIEVIDLERACSEGLLEEIPRDILVPGTDGTLAEKDFIPAALANECGVATIVATMVYAYNNDTIGDDKPQTIADLFNTQQFPGKRAFRKRPQGNMEWALIADGVNPSKVYDVLATETGQKRAFTKLDTIKDDIIWYESWSQAPQLLNDGGAVLVQSANGRIFNAMKRDNKPFNIVWDNHIYDFGVWAIVKGSQKKELALEFIAYATQSKPLAGMVDVAYGPTRKSSAAFVEAAVRPDLPTSHMEKGIKADSIFWADYGESLGEKFNEWLLQ